MSQSASTATGQLLTPPDGLQGVVADWSSDQRAFTNVPWGKAFDGPVGGNRGCADAGYSILVDMKVRSVL